MPNTGRIRYREVDSNRNSPTFGQERWGAYETNTDACPIPTTYLSAALQEEVTRNNCAPGLFPGSVRYTLTAGAFTSTLSQADADSQARTYFDVQKQIFANATATCSNNPFRSVTITNMAQGVKFVTLTLTRTDSAGDATVTVQVDADSDDGSGNGTQTVTRTAQVIILSGTTSKTVTLGFGPGAISQVVAYQITSVDPPDYAY